MLPYGYPDGVVFPAGIRNGDVRFGEKWDGGFICFQKDPTVLGRLLKVFGEIQVDRCKD